MGLVACALLSCAGCSRQGAPLHLSSDVEGHVLRPLRGPYAVEARRPLVGGPVSIVPPASFPPPQRDALGTSFYVDAQRSVIDPRLRKENERGRAGIVVFGQALMSLTDGYLRSRPAQPVLAAAALDGMHQWASAGALLGAVNRQGSYHLKWALGAFALDYLKIRDAGGLDPAKKAVVELWLRHLGAEVVSYYSQNPSWGDHTNNHLYWAAMAAAAAGAASGDATLLEWGIAQYPVFVRSLKPDGTLPAEMARGRRALHYHLFALAPLVMLAEIAAANGVDLHARGDHALDRLVTRCLEGLRDPATFAAAAGAPQMEIEPSDLGWMEPYYARSHRPDLLPWMKSRPLISGELGGDMTLAFGLPDPERAPDPPPAGAPATASGSPSF